MSIESQCGASHTTVVVFIYFVISAVLSLVSQKTKIFYHFVDPILTAHKLSYTESNQSKAKNILCNRSMLPLAFDLLCEK